MEYDVIQNEIDASLKVLHGLNPSIAGSRKTDGRPASGPRRHRLQKVLVANRGEIAKRFFLALHEEGIPSVAVVTDPDRGQSWYEFADEVVFIGDHENYASIPFIIAATLLSRANAVYSGYGFLSENVDFVEALESMKGPGGEGVLFMGPRHDTMRLVGDKMNARLLARRHGVPLFESSEGIAGDDAAAARREAARIGYPVMVKLCAGGGGKGVYPAADEAELARAVASAARIGEELYRDPSFYLEKYLEKPVHIEVQIFNGWAIGLRKCAVQRRHQKIIEESGHAFLDNYLALELLAAAEKIAHLSGYAGGGAGTVEFLIDTETGKIGFMEMNTRLQVEYAVTDQSLGIDIAKWQILYFDGREAEIIGLETLKGRIAENDHSIECRIYAEEPENDYLPSPGTIIEMDLPTFNGIRCDFGFMEGDAILPMYDPMIGKLIAHGATRKEAIIRLERALQELYISGVKTNISQLLMIVRHPVFARGDYTNNFLRENAELNFREPDAGKPAGSDRRALKHVIFGAFTEHLRLLREAVNGFSVIAGMGGIIDAPAASDIPSRYTIEYQGQRHQVEFIQTAIDTFYCFVRGAYNGAIILTAMNDRCDDFLLIFGSSSFRVRVNRHTGYMDLRMKDESNKVRYYRVTVVSEQFSEARNVRNVTSPFQGAFVSFCRELRPGDAVTAGEPIMILSSMKMENTIVAPESGRITYLIGDGDASSLRTTRTAGGRTGGRSIQENELLAVIETEETPGAEAAAPEGTARSAGGPSPTSLLDLLMGETFADEAAGNLSAHFKTLLELVLAAARGYVYQPAIIEALKRAVRKIPAAIDDGAMTGEAVRLLHSVIIHHTNIKKLFSPVVSGEGLSFQEELNLYLAGRQGPPAASLRPFDLLLKTLFESYDLPRWDGKSEMNALARQYIFVLFKRAYQFCLEQTDIIKKIVRIVASAGRPGKETLSTLARLMEQEQAERDDSLLKFIKTILRPRLEESGFSAYRGGDHDGPGPLPVTGAPGPGAFSNEEMRQCAASLDSAGTGAQHPTAGPDGSVPPERMAALEKNYRVRRLYSPIAGVIMLLLEHPDDPTARSYLAVSAAGPPDGTGAGRGIDDAFADAARVMRAYRDCGARGQCWIEVTAVGLGLSWEPAGETGAIAYAEFKRLCAACLDSAHDLEPLSLIATLDIRPPFSATAGERGILIYRKNDATVIEYLLPSDRRNPYHAGEEASIATQRLLDAGKWPIEAWAEECFDPGSMKEIRVPSIDETDGAQASELRIITRPVGAKIFYGTVGGAPACFYMKDSRVSGGSTGSREGLKYIAAAYLSYLSDWPLYVWNDSAGANIMEGVISLNRGAEGFMMNALLTGRAGSATFRSYVEHTADPELGKLFGELNAGFGLSYDSLDRRHRSFQLIAVGIGSSAGLDVYGSSQASIQVLLDSEESYRVLTGSKVIQTVIGEEISNYDIGGAKILGAWTGIVDIVACDKIHLVRSVRLIQGVFGTGKQLPSIQRLRRLPPAPEKAGGSIVFSESMVRQNVDDGLFCPFKENYYAAEALIGGFARIGGRRVLVMGPRTHSGLRSLASVIKARELLRTAQRTGSHRILIFGRKFLQTPDFHENVQMRPRIDFIGALMNGGGTTVHMITHPDGLKAPDLNSAADALIFILSRTESAADMRFIENNATFLADSFDEAFDLACRIIAMIDPLEAPAAFSPPAAAPSIPVNAAEPYDMVASVITRVFDDGSFLEFFRDMNNPITGPTLITGLAALEGRTVGVIADQPLLKGGGADAFGTEKFRVFTEFLNRARIPLVMLSNSSGFVPGSQQERFRIQAIGAESLDANVLGTIPVVSVVLNQNYGGRLIHAFNKFLRPGIVYLALEQAIMAVIGVDAAFDLLYGKKYARLVDRGEPERAEELRSGFAGAYIEKARAFRDGVDSGLVDWTIPSAGELRAHLVRGLALACRRCEEAFGGAGSDKQSNH